MITKNNNTRSTKGKDIINNNTCFRESIRHLRTKNENVRLVY